MYGLIQPCITSVLTHWVWTHIMGPWLRSCVFNCIGSSVNYKPCSSARPFLLPLPVSNNWIQRLLSDAICFLLNFYNIATYLLFWQWKISSCTCVCTRPEDRDITLDYLSRPSLSLSDHAIYCTTFEPPYGKGCNNWFANSELIN